MGILRTNVPKARWVQVEAAPFDADYALKSSDSRYIAMLKYSGKQDENFVWTVTVRKVKSTAESVTAATPPAKSASPITSPSSSPDLTAPANWDYAEQDDEMGRGKEKFARVVSDNAVDFSFPYQGEQHLRLTLRKSPKLGNDVILQIERGQFMSSYNRNFVTVKFDNGELQKFVVGDSAEGKADVLFIRHYDRFVSQIRKAKRLKIEADFYSEGSRVFEFDVQGLRANW